MADSWEDVARVLGERMAYQANQCPVGSGPQFDGGDLVGTDDSDRHIPEEHVHDCPFCADTVAWKRYVRKAAASRKYRSP